MKTSKKRLIACAAAISFLAAVQQAAGREVERPETAARTIAVGGVFRVRRNRNWFRLPKKVKPSFRNPGRR